MMEYGDLFYSRRKMRFFPLLFIIILTLTACQHDETDAYLKETATWKAKRLERLKSEDGWLNLAGLF